MHLGRAQPTTSDTRSRLEVDPQPDPFKHAHAALRDYMHKTSEMEGRQGSPLYSSPPQMFLNRDDIRVGFHQPPPLAHAPSRVDNQNLNFDFGELALGPDESLMTWF